MSKERVCKETIIITSNEPWGDIWYSKQHYTNELVKKGFLVYFVNAPDSWKISDLFSWKINVKEVKTNLFTVSYKNIFPTRVIFSLFLKLNDLINCFRLYKKLNLKNQKFIWWQFDFHRFINIWFFKNYKRIYHVVDANMINNLDKKIALDSDLVVCTSPKYTNYYENLGCQKVIQIPHGISRDEFLLNSEIVKKVKEKYGDFVIFVGTINDDVSLEIFLELANNGIKLLIIGKEFLSSEKKQNLWNHIKKNKKIIYLGTVHAQNLKNYIAAARAGIVAYNFNLKKAIGSRSPLKIVNYLPQKIPVITSTDSEIPELENKVIFRANNMEEYIKKVSEAVNGALLIIEDDSKSYLDKIQYQYLISKILDALDN